MPKRFSVIDCGDKVKVVSGFVEPDTLPNVSEVLEVLADTSTYEQVPVKILHMVFLDFPDAHIADATAKEVEILQEELANFYDEGYLETKEVVEITLRGLSKDTDIVEAGDI